MNILLADFGSTYTKITLVNIESRKILGTAKSFTTIESDILNGFENAKKILIDEIGNVEINEVLACSSAAGGLKIVAIGLVEELTSEAATQAALSAGAKVLKTYSYELNKSEVKEIEESKPDIILIVGGTDGGNKKVIIHNSKMIASILMDIPIIYAGNKSAIDEVEEILVGKNLHICNNVMPKINELNIHNTREKIRELFLANIIRAKGLTNVEKLIDNILMPTPSAVLLGTTLLSSGCDGVSGIGDMILVDIGGATTDIHSICDGMPTSVSVVFKGIEEPFAKRTVEGDLGVRYNANSIVDFIKKGNLGIAHDFTNEELDEYISIIEKNPDIISSDKRFKEFDLLLASVCVKIAVKRHAGTREKFHTLAGVMYTQVGKDLTEVKTIVGTGGPIINSEFYKEILSNSLYEESEYKSLRPKKCTMLIDKKYILAAMGLLSTKYPLVALEIMKENIVLL